MRRRGDWGARQALLALVALVGLAGAVGCELKEELADSAPRVACASDQDCPAGDRCDPEFGACVTAGAPALAVGVQLSPPPTADYVTTQFPRLTAEGGGTLDLTLPPPTRVRGDVRTGNNLLEPNVPATISARAPGDIPGTEYRFDADSKRARTEDDPYGYELRVATGKTYKLTVMLENRKFPPYSFERRLSEADLVLDIEVPALTEHSRISGRLVSNAGAPVSGVRVAAFSLDSEKVSTVVEVEGPEGDAGAFVLFVAPGAERYQLRVEPTNRVDAIPAHTVIDELLVDGDVELGDVEVALLPPKVEATVSVEGPDAAPVEGALVRCRGEVAGGTLTDEGTTGPDGRVGLFLRKGIYECVCLPPAGNVAAAGRWDIEAGPEKAESWTFYLGTRARVDGSVCDHSGERALADVTLIAVHLGDLDPRRGTEEETTTDEAGDFVIHLEPGVYAFVLLPPEGSQHPVKIFPSVDVPGDTTLPLRLDRAMAVSGTVRGGYEGEPVPGVRVEFFLAGGAVPGAPDDGVDAAEPTGYDRLLRVIGSAVTDAEGRYQALLPAPTSE